MLRFYLYKKVSRFLNGKQVAKRFCHKCRFYELLHIMSRELCCYYYIVNRFLDSL